ncbi:tetratricopeptide repeat protein [Streptomyces sp. DG2A-72]|uniref:tetratricopeptide repeat protein n=1 Tax=Streptomyces sp. DG2A-72 TaxID=3051386 RepID=UPI00265C4D6C|nr:tetratricopeptide repeat protein [Streptomyces sp. DG2A-72]MDO0936486.1 tetratricopeptide repeat protein [Streptomyces sp. DG2A-72]
MGSWRKWIEAGRSVADERALEYLSNGRPSRAVRYFKGRLREQSKRLGWEHHETLITLCHLGAAYREAGRIEESVTLLTQNYGQLQRLFGNQDAATILCVSELAASIYAAGDRDAAHNLLSLLSEALDEARRLLGDAAAETLSLECQLALFYRAEGRLFEALSLMSTAGLYADVLGSNHSVTRQAETIWDEIGAAVKRMTDSFNDPDRHPLSATDRAAVSMTQAVAMEITTMREDRDGFQEVWHRAAKLWDYARRWYETHDGADHMNTLAAVEQQADCLVICGEGEAAIPLREAVYAERKKALGPDHPDTVKAEYNLARGYLEHGQVPAAIVLAEHVVDVWKRTHGPSDRYALSAMRTLAYGLHSMGRISEAEPLLQHLEDNGWEVRISNE